MSHNIVVKLEQLKVEFKQQVPNDGREVMPIAEAAALGTLSSLIASGLTRCGSLALAKAQRLKRIDSILQSEKLQNPLVKTALNDFRTVLGTYRGEYTEQIEYFLQELEKSGLITLIAEEAILGTHSKEVQRAFNDLHALYINEDEERARKLLDSIRLSFSVTVKELISDKALGIVIEAQHKALFEKVGRIEEGLGRMQTPSRADHISAKELNEHGLKLSKSLVNQLKNINIETNRGPREIEISRIYTPARLIKRDAQAFLKRFGDSAILSDSEPYEYQRRLVDKNVPKVAEFSYRELSSSFQRVVILGDPGGGKSTLCQYLCHELAKQSSMGFQFGKPQGLIPQNQKIPLRVVLRSFENARISQPQLDLLTYITKDLVNYTSLQEHEIRSTLIYLLRFGRAVIAFDGLDEILESSKRREFVALVSAFADTYPLCPVIVTSRAVGYDEAPLPRNFDDFILEGFDEE